MQNSATRFYSTQMISSFQISLLYQSHIHSIFVSERRALTSSLRGVPTLLCTNEASPRFDEEEPQFSRFASMGVGKFVNKTTTSSLFGVCVAFFHLRLR